MTWDLVLKLVSACVALAALVLSLVNYNRTSRVADRQYNLAYTQEVLKWSADVLQAYRKIRQIREGTATETERVENVGDLYREVSVFTDQGSLLFPKVSHPIQAEVFSFYVDLRNDYRGLRRKTLAMSALDRSKYIKSRRRFVSEVRKLPGVQARFDKGTPAA